MAAITASTSPIFFSTSVFFREVLEIFTIQFASKLTKRRLPAESLMLFLASSQSLDILTLAMRSFIWRNTCAQNGGEIADVLAWILAVAVILDIDAYDAVIRVYGKGCPGCGQPICECPNYYITEAGIEHRLAADSVPLHKLKS